MTAPAARPDLHQYLHESRFKERIMKNRSYVVGWLFLVLTSLGWGQGPTCNTSTYWCGPYSPPSTSNVGVSAFKSTPPIPNTGQNTWGMTANDINSFYDAK